jgi:hypothetical protein
MGTLMDASLETTEICLEKIEANRGKLETKMEPCLEEIAVETIGALEDRYGDRRLALGRFRQPKKRTQDDGGSRKKLAAARRRVTYHTVPARRKGRGLKGPTVEKRLECNSGIRNRGGSYATSEEGEDIRQDLQEDGRAGDGKANSRVFDWATGSE